ncbi:MAG: hypothetical protein RBS01_00235 [Candidatus Dojkabacteria bacterium]|jgi:hypothetical protein|nr:hypothetical protein [Candidatus Dojkabacteria bacterium]
MCDFCEFKQYCKDCKEEQEPPEVIASDYNCRSQKNNCVYISDEHLHHKGRSFQISDVIEGKGMPQKSIIETKEGFRFHVRELKDKTIVLTKIVKTRPQKEGRPDCQECIKIFIGKLPPKLIADPNW